MYVCLQLFNAFIFNVFTFKVIHILEALWWVMFAVYICPAD